MTAAVVGGLAQSLAGTAGTLLAREIGGSDAVAGLPQAMQVGGSSLAAVALSALALRRGRGVALSTGSALGAAASGVVLLSAVLSSITLMLVGSLLIGAGNTAVMLGRYAAADLVPEAERTRAMGAVLVATTVGGVAGPNLLVPAAAVARIVGISPLAGPYVVVAAAYVVLTAVLTRGLGGLPEPAVLAAAATTPTDRPAPTRPAASALPGIAVLSVANLVMVGVMTMAPVQMDHVDAGLGLIGIVVGAHIAAMYAPSGVSARLADRIGIRRAAATAGVLLAAASTMAALTAATPLLLLVAMLALGGAWNLALVSGSALLTAGVPAAARPQREGWGEVGMGVAAAVGGAASGLVMAVSGYAVLAVVGAVTAVGILPFVRRDAAARTGRTSR